MFRRRLAMHTALPKKERNYNGVVSDTRVWDEFELRPDDVIISTPPKCGTTWTQTIALMLLRKTDRLEDSVWKLSPWIDCKFRPESPELLAAATNRRCIKSHAPLDGIKYCPEATYIAVYRHPVDVHFSLQNHAGAVRLMRTSLWCGRDTAPYVAKRPRHSARAAVRLALK